MDGAEKPGLKMDYSSPRWTQEVADCSMPMTFDTYSKCAYGCLYCFSYFQKAHTLEGYRAGDVRCVNPARVQALFDGAIANDPKGVALSLQQFFPYIRARRIMQWGGLADQFDEYERRFGVTLELLRYFDRIDYPLSFSTKAAWWTQDSRYMDLFARHRHNWHVKVSIITADAERARKVERGVPPPAERLEAVRRLSDLGIHVTLRLRPYIIGVSQDWKKLVRLAHDAGADSMTVEFFCMESRAQDDLKKRYAAMSEVCGYDLYEFYMKNSPQNGYKRLSRGIKAPVIHEMRELAHSLEMRFHVSDAFCRECNDSCNCCGVPPEWGASYTGHMGQAVLIAKDRGEVHFSDIADAVNEMYGFSWEKANGYNTATSQKRARYSGATMAEFLRHMWNSPKSGSGPVRGYGGILRPAGIDENGDVVYRYTAKDGEAHGGIREGLGEAER